MTLRDYLNILRERFAIIIATVLVVTSVALVFSFRQIPQYESTSRLEIIPLGAGTQAIKVLEEEGINRLRPSVATEAEIVRSTPVAERVIERLGLTDTPEYLLERIEVSSPIGADVLKITAYDIDRATAKRLADAFADGYIETKQEQAVTQATNLASNLRDQLTQAQEELDQLEAELSQISREASEWQAKSGELYWKSIEINTLRDQYAAVTRPEALQNGGGRIIQYGVMPAEASSPNHVRNGILGLLVALPLAVGLTLLRDSLSDTVKTKEEAERLTGAETLALIPADPNWRHPAEPRVASLIEPSSLVAEAYRTMRVNLEFHANERDARFIMVTSPGRAEGKSATVANLGVAFAEAGRRTVTVSADGRSPRLHAFLNAPVEPGLAEALAGTTRGTEYIHQAAPNLWVVPSGTSGEIHDLRIARRDMESLFGRLGAGAARLGSTLRRGTTGRAGSAPAAGSLRSSTLGNTPLGARGGLRGAGQSDMVLMDSPAILRAAESSALASTVDGVILVLHAGVTRRVAATRAVEQIRKVGGRVLGIALVGVRADDLSDESEDDGRRGDGIVNRAWDRVLEGLRR